MRTITLSDEDYFKLQQELRNLRNFARVLPDDMVLFDFSLHDIKSSIRIIIRFLDSPTARVILFDFDGALVGEEEWRIPPPATVGTPNRPSDLGGSPDFHRINGGAVLVPEQEVFPNFPSYLFNAVV